MCIMPVYAIPFFASMAVRNIVSIQTSSKKNPTYHREE